MRALPLVLLLAACSAVAQDFEREKRWAAEVVPVLDLYGEKDLPQVLRADWRRRMTLSGIPGSKQVMIPGADHQYTGRERELGAEIHAFVSQLK